MTADEIVTRWSNEAERLALLFAGAPDARVEASLADFRARVLAGFVDLFDDADPGDLAEVAECIVDEIRARKREIEAASAGQAHKALL